MIYCEELEFVQRLVQRDCQSWHAFVKQYMPFIRRRIVACANECRFFLGEEEIEDIRAEVLRSLVARDMAPLRNFRGSSRFSTWLSVVVRRTAMAWMDRRPVDRARGEVGSLSDRLNIPIQPEPAIADLIRQEEYAQLKLLQAELRDSDRQILTYYFSDGLSYFRYQAAHGHLRERRRRKAPSRTAAAPSSGEGVTVIHQHRQNDVALLLQYVSSDLDQLTIQRLESRLAVEPELKELLVRIRSVGEGVVSPDAAAEWAPETIAGFVDGSLVESEAVALAEACGTDDCVLAEVVSAFRFAVDDPGVDDTADTRPGVMPIEIAQLLDESRVAPGRSGGGSRLKAVAMVVGLLVATLVLSFVFLPAPGTAPVVDTKPDDPTRLEPKSSPPLQASSNNLQHEAPDPRALPEPVENAELVAYVSYQPENVPLELQWRGITGLVAKRDMGRMRDQGWAGINAELVGATEFATLGNSTARASIPGVGSMLLLPNTRIYAFRDQMGGRPVIRVLDGRVAFQGLKAGTTFQIQQFSYAAIEVQVLKNRSSMVAGFDRYSFSTTVQMGSVSVSGLIDANWNRPLGRVEHIYDEDTELGPAQRRVWWPEKMVSVLPASATFSGACGLPREMHVKMRRSTDLVDSISSLAREHSWFCDRALLLLNCESRFHDMLLSPDGTSRTAAINRLFGRSTGSYSRAAIFQDLRRHDLPQSLQRAVARVTGGGPFLLSFEDAISLAEGLDSAEPGLRELAYRATLIAFPSVLQRIDYSPTSSLSDREVSVNAFRAEIHTIAQRRGFVRNSWTHRYDWNE